MIPTQEDDIELDQAEKKSISLQFDINSECNINVNIVNKEKDNEKNYADWYRDLKEVLR